MSPAVAALARAILAKALRPSEFNNAADRFLTALFDATEDLQRLGMPAFLSTAHLYDIQAVLPELDGGTPLLLLSTPGYDASHKVEIIAREQRIRLKAIAMGSGEAIDEASVALHSAMQAGTWVLLKNVHLCPAYLDDLEKRVHTARLEGSSHANFRLVLASETTNKLPRSLVHGSRILTFEPPPGIKSSLTRTFASAAATLPQHPAETSRLTFVAAWLHAVIVERTRYVPLGWSKRYEFSEADFHRTASTVSAWLQQAAAGRHNIAPTDIPWTAIRSLVRDTVYGGKIDNPCDLELIDSLTTTYLCPAVFSPSFKFEGNSLTCEHFTKEDLVGWISQLPDVEPPEWLGLPASATTMVLEQAAHRTIKKLQDVQVSVLADAAAAGDAEEGRGPAWMIKLGSVIDTIASLVPGGKIASIASPDPTDPIQLALQREVSTGNTVLRRVQTDLEELRAIVKGDQKPTNHARALIDVLMHDTTPPRWHPYPLAANLPLTAWASDLSHRVGFLGKLAQNGGNGNINLGALFHPGAFVTATRQLVARKTTKSLEVLRLVCAINALPSALTFAMEGVTLIGADVNQNGALVASGSTGTDVVLSLTWTSDADDAKTETRCAVPLYLNSQRTELIALCSLPIEGTAQSFTLQGVCLSSWRQR
jgi:dynein heavy chain 1